MLLKQVETAEKILQQPEDLSDKEIKALSLEHPEQIFEDGRGRIAWAGSIYKDKATFERQIRLQHELHQKPFFKMLERMLFGIAKFFDRRKESH